MVFSIVVATAKPVHLKHGRKMRFHSFVLKMYYGFFFIVRNYEETVRIGQPFHRDPITRFVSFDLFGENSALESLLKNLQRSRDSLLYARRSRRLVGEI